MARPDGTRTGRELVLLGAAALVAAALAFFVVEYVGLSEAYLRAVMQ